jgi:Xaa-Pro aminopeptidase
VLPTAPERVRNRDTHYPFRFDSHFWYLTAFPEPEAVLVVVAGESPRSVLFCRERSAEREVWDGFRYGPEAARERFGFDATFPISALDAEMPKLLANQPALHYPLGADPAWDARALKWLNAVRENARSGIAAPERVHDVRALIDEMRLIKDAESLRSCAARRRSRQRRIGARCSPRARGEWSTRSKPSCCTNSGAVARSSRRTGRLSPAARTLACCTMCSTMRSCATASSADRRGLRAPGYASDITRTFPVNGRYSGAHATSTSLYWRRSKQR